MKFETLCCCGFLLLSEVGPTGSAQEWTRFRGPNGSGISDAKTIPTTWNERDLNWKIQLPGVGHSSPVLWGEQIFLTSNDEKAGKRSVLCLNATDGTIAWRRDFDLVPFERHQYNSLASATPAVEADRVYVAWNTPEHYTLMAFDHNGKTIWERDLGAFKSQHACGSSPIIYKDTVILDSDQDGDSAIFAVDKRSGEIRWKVPRKIAVTAYSTPCLYEVKGKKPAIIFNSQAHGITAIDPENGKVLWEYANAFDKRTVSSPFIASGLIMGSCGSGGGGNYVVAIRPGDGEKKPELAYEIRRSAPYVPTPVSVGDLLFLWGDSGILSCVHGPSGEIKWQERVSGDFFGSPVYVDGRLICVSATGEVVVVEASDQFRPLARIPLGETCRSTPAIAGGRMYIRTVSHLFSVGGKKETPSK